MLNISLLLPRDPPHPRLLPGFHRTPSLHPHGDEPHPAGAVHLLTPLTPPRREGATPLIRLHGVLSPLREFPARLIVGAGLHRHPRYVSHRDLESTGVPGAEGGVYSVFVDNCLSLM